MAQFCLTADQAQWPLYDLRSKDRMSDEVCPVFGRSARSPSHRTRSADRFVPLRFLLPARLATHGVCDRWGIGAGLCEGLAGWVAALQADGENEVRTKRPQASEEKRSHGTLCGIGRVGERDQYLRRRRRGPGGARGQGGKRAGGNPWGSGR